MKGNKRGNSEAPYIAAVLVVVVIVALTSIFLLRRCQKKVEAKSFLKIDVSTSPEKGIEPLLVRISISVESSENIEYVRIDFDGDRKFDLERKPKSRKYSERLTFEYIVPEDEKGKNDESTGFPTLLTEFYYPVTLCVIAENKIQKKEKCKTLNIISVGKPKFNLLANTCSGEPPLEVKLKVEFTEKVYDRYIIKWDCDGDGRYEKEGEELETTCSFEVSGLYPTKVSVSAPNRKYTISKYMYCGKVSPGLISKYIEVLPEKVIPHKMLALPPLVFHDYEVQRKDTGEETSPNVLMLFGGNPGLLVLNNGKISDLLGVFFSPVVDEETKEIQESRITTFPFNVLFSKIWGNKIFITSDSGTYIAEIHEQRKIINNLKKITNSQIAVFPSPISESKVFLAIDILTGNIMKCEDEELKLCSISNELNEQKIIRKIKHKYNQGELFLLVIYSDNSSEIILFDGDNIQKEKIPFEISEDDNVEVGNDRLYIISGNASSEIRVYDKLSKKTEKINQPDGRVLFTSAHEITEDKILLGMVEVPCPNSETLKSCNLSLYDMKENKFLFFEGSENISDFLFDMRVTQGGISSSPENEVRDIYILKSGGSVEKIKAEFSNDAFYLSQQTHVGTVPLPAIRDMNAGTTEIYVLTPKVLISFSSSGYYLGSFSIKEGFIDKMAKAGEYIFVGISDNIATSRKGEGKFIVLDKFREVLRYSSEDISNSVFSCMYAVSENSNGGEIGTNNKQNTYLIFTCTGNKLKILEFNSDKKRVTQRCEAELSSQGVDIEYFKNIFVATQDKLLTFDKRCNQISSESSLVQFFQLDIDRERELLFSAEGDNHSFRLWDIKGGYPQEITRFSLDFGVEGDISGGIAHIGSTLYVGSTHTTLLIFDIRDPQKPRLLRKVWITENFGSVLKCQSVMYENEIACLSPGASILFFR